MILNKTTRFELPEVPQTQDLYARWDDGPADGTDDMDSGYRRYIALKWVLIVACIAVCVVVAGLAVTVGEYPVGFGESYWTIWNHIFGYVPTDHSDPLYILDHVVWDLRLPRIIIGIVAGAGLAVAGATMQSTLKNPLADPYTTGISSGAAFGATIAICYGTGIFGSGGSIVVNAFVFALIPTALIAVISVTKKVSPVSMILAGIAVMYIFNAMTTVMKLWANPDDLASVYRWEVGSFEGLDWGDVPIMTAVTAVGALFLLLVSSKMNVLSTGDENAKALGIDASKLRMVCLVVVTLVTASIVSFTGVIGFVGLVAPHVVRIFIGSDNRYLIPASMALGAALLLVADLVGRTVIAPAVLEVGVVTAFIGGPLFLYLVIRQKREAW